jgi:D-sedoheptulose 7-phosphate isomerase
MNFLRQTFEEARSTLDAFMADDANFVKMEQAAQKMYHALSSGNKIMSCGNGGSMSDAMHFAEELSGRFRENRKAMAAMAISDPGHLSCVANDFGYNQVFSRAVEALGKPGDVLLGISTSGNSENVLQAIETAKAAGIYAIALTGKDGGRIAAVCDLEIRAPKTPYADRAQEIHIKIIHALIGRIEALMKC